MSRMFAYCRVSTTEQSTENQILAIEKAGYFVEPQRVVSETVSGSTQAFSRKKFKALIEYSMEAGDTLIVLKLDRLGRDSIDLQSTISFLIDKGIKVVCLDLPVHDLTSSEGKLMLQLFGAFAEFERNRLIERTQAGLERAKAEGKKLGRPEAKETTLKVLKAKREGYTQSLAAERLGLSLPTIKRHWNKAL